MNESPALRQELPPVLITLFKGVVYQDANPALWQALLALQVRVRDYVTLLGLELILDEAEGYAYLRQKPRAEDEEGLPRLVQRRPLSYPVSLLLALLRKKLAEFDASGGDTRLILTREQLLELVRVFLPETVNEAKLLDRLDTHVNRLVDLGFLRRLRGQENQFEVMRILKTFVDAQWLSELDERLTGYRRHATGADE